MLIFLPFACCNLISIYCQITINGRKSQKQVNGYSPKKDENQRFRPSRMGGYSPKNDAESASFLQVGGYSPKSDAAAAKKHSQNTSFILFLGEYLPKCYLFKSFLRSLFSAKCGWV
jgi:hypothetical protein